MILQKDGGQVGKTISHYRILEKLGQGGMGVVYKAEDMTLKREVAIKFLPHHIAGDSTAVERFKIEAQAAAALNHPNIAIIHAIEEVDDETFIVMEYVKGKSLRNKIESGPLELNEALDFAIQISQGLSKAHEKGITHRDIKPSNVMVSDDGVAKILDFGLAKIAEGSLITKEGTTLGTAAYMSPEQVRGEPVDHRTDIWSMGVALYEMITGNRPFKGEYEQAVMYSVLNVEPEPVTRFRSEAPAGLERIVAMALKKNPEDRYGTMREFLADLKKIRQEEDFRTSHDAAREARPKSSIAVLPFRNMSADEEQEYFCEGISEEIINALTHVEGMRVIARSSAFAFKGKNEDIREIGKKLSIDTVLEGSVRRSGKRLRITAELVNVNDGCHIWSERYDREMEDVFAIQDEISLAIVEHLRVKLLGAEKAAVVKRHTDDVEAYNLYLKGRYFWNRRHEKGHGRAIECFEQAIDKDPSYSLAHSGMADCYNLLGLYCFMPPKEAYSRAKAAAEKAVQSDNALAEGHTSLAWVKAFYDRDWAAGENEFKRALELNPKYPTGHYWYALFLAAMGRFDEAIMESKQALKLDPLAPIVNYIHGIILYASQKYDDAIEHCLNMTEMDPNFPLTYHHLGYAYLEKKMWDEAIAAHKKFVNLFEGSFAWGILGCTYGMAGLNSKAQKVVGQLEDIAKERYISPAHKAQVYMGLGERDRAFKYFEEAVAERDSIMVLIRVTPWPKLLRDDSRFPVLLKKIGLE